MKSHSDIELIEMNAQKTPLNTLNDSVQLQFSLFNESDVLYLPVPALQLMIGSELSDIRHLMDDNFIKNEDNHKLFFIN